MTFRRQLVARFKRLALTMISKKMVSGMVWAAVDTGLLVRGIITEQTWSTVLIFILGIIFGVAAVEKIGGVKYDPPQGE